MYITGKRCTKPQTNHEAIYVTEVKLLRTEKTEVGNIRALHEDKVCGETPICNRKTTNRIETTRLKYIACMGGSKQIQSEVGRNTEGARGVSITAGLRRF